MIAHAWESVSRAGDWRRDQWVCAGCGRAIFKRATGPNNPPTKALLRQLAIPVDCDEEKVRQVMET